MKQIKWFGRAFVAILMSVSFSACSNETEDFFASGNEIKLTSAITPTTRAANQLLQSTQIVTTQEVGVTITGAKSEHNNVKWLAGEDASLTNTGNTLYWGSSDIDIMAYHPFNQDWSGTTHTFSVNTDQSSDKNYLNSDLLWIKTTASKSSNPIELQFTHKLAKIMVGIQHEDGETEVTSAIVSICGTKPSATFNLSTGAITNPNGSVADIKAAQAASAAAIIIPQTINAGTKFIKVEFNGKTFYYTLSENKTFESGKAYDFTLTLKEKGSEPELSLTSPTEGNITDWDSENNSTNGDANEEETSNTPAPGIVIIENSGLSQALLTIYGSEKVKINDNGYAVMTETDANAVKELNLTRRLDNSDITTLEGIEFFKNLTTLYCGAALTSLETCDISKNIALTKFYATNTLITALDFSNNPNMKEIYCHDNQNLSSLNLTGCTQLSFLGIINTAIETASLTIPDNVKTAITDLMFSGTSLSLDLNKFQNLQILACTNMNLNTLDGFIPETTMKNLFVLKCENNQLSELDLSKFPNLKYLYCFNNKISTLNISQNSKLTEWYCGGQNNNNNNTIVLTLTSSQENLWESSQWKNQDNNNVTLNVITPQ